MNDTTALQKYFNGWAIINSWKELPIIPPTPKEESLFKPIILQMDEHLTAYLEIREKFMFKLFTP
jgi:hypothetical protein